MEFKMRKSEEHIALITNMGILVKIIDGVNFNRSQLLYTEIYKKNSFTLCATTEAEISILLI